MHIIFQRIPCIRSITQSVSLYCVVCKTSAIQIIKTLFTGTTLTQDTSSGGKHGMGIGLSVCAAIIKAHGGEIKAESTPGEGTTIRFWLETEEVDTEETEDEQ